jgi:filamentous hemagglutinin family protein
MCPAARSQIIPDATLGDERSIAAPDVINNLPADRINGGAIRGSNLFHSFEEFNIPEGRGAYFSNPDGIANILTRVTGKNPSNLLGTLGVLGNANLFFLNPNGIVFGPNARFDVRGSFFASTADSFVFDNGLEFSAIAPQPPSLLTVNIPLGLRFRDNPNLAVMPTLPEAHVSTLLFNPKDLQIQPGNEIGNLAIAALNEGGVRLQANNDITIEDSITGTGGHDLSLLAGRSIAIANNRAINLNGGNFTARFNDETVVAEQREPGLARFFMNPGSQIATNGGNIAITSGNFETTSEIQTANAQIQSNITASPTPSENRHSGNITLMAIGDLTTGIITSRSPNNSGNIRVSSLNGNLTGTNFITSEAKSQGGNITLEAGGNLSFTTPRDILQGASILAAGATPGNLVLTAGNRLEARGISIVNASTGNGTPSNVTVTARSIFMQDSVLGAQTFAQGQGGDLSITVADEIILNDSNLNTASVGSRGNAGNLILQTRRLSIVREVGSSFPYPVGVGAITFPGTTGNGGNITIDASESIEMLGDIPGAFALNPQTLATSLRELSTGISTSAFGTGNSGNLLIRTDRLVVRDGAGVTTFPPPRPDARGGSLSIEAREIELHGKGGIGSLTSDSGETGDLTVRADLITLTDGAAIGVLTTGQGDAGDLTLSVRQLRVQNGSALASVTFAGGDGGTITIQDAETIEVSGSTPGDRGVNSTIVASTGQRIETTDSGKAGVLAIGTERLDVSDGGRISVESFGVGSAGRIDIVADAIVLDTGSRIDAASRSGGVEGNINLQAGEIQLRRGSRISTDASTNGGNINIVSDILLAFPYENSDITANATTNQGGQVRLNVPNIFGLAAISRDRLQQELGLSDAEFATLEEPASLLSSNDIAAISQGNPSLQGLIAFETSGINPAQALVELPQSVVDPAALIASNLCNPNQGQLSQFFILGRGGLPPTPDTLLSENDVRVEWSKIQPFQSSIFSVISHQSLGESPVAPRPAGGWTIDDLGKVTLVPDNSSNANFQRSSQRSETCLVH